MDRKKNRRRGFTLLELMIVLVILVLLFAMVGPRLLGTQKQGGYQGRKTQIGNLEAGLNLYAVDMRTFPSTEEGLIAIVESPSEEGSARRWDGPYLDDDVLPRDPWDNEFQYEYPPSRNVRDFPDIWSLGPDGEPDTDDDIGNWCAVAEGENEPGEDGHTMRDRPSEPRGGGTGGGGAGKGSTGGGARK